MNHEGRGCGGSPDMPMPQQQKLNFPAGRFAGKEPGWNDPALVMHRQVARHQEI